MGILSSASTPMLSIGLPVFNGEMFLEETLHSLLTQTFDDFELIISDNASTDGTWPLCEACAARDPRIRIVRNASNLGAAANYNQTFRLARGKFFKWAAHDDLCAPTFFEACIAALEANSTAVLCTPRALIIDAAGEVKGRYAFSMAFGAERPSERFRQFLHAQGSYAVFGVIRSAVLAQTGLIGTFPMADRVLLAELVLRGPFIELPEYLFWRRKHPQISTVANPTDRGLLTWYDPTIHRRRVLPRWQRLGRYLRAIHVTPMPAQERWLCHLHLSRVALMPGRWKTMLQELASASISSMPTRRSKPP
jgi:glycosyltransferase involved in cell wall biosynthesis